MKKSSKILGSVALSAALAMGTAVPAFAADNSPSGDEITMPTEMTESAAWRLSASNAVDIANGAENGASTIVTVSTYTSQLNITVPLYLPVWLDTAGGPAITPSDGAYYIQNASPVDVAVSKVTYANYTGTNASGLSIGKKVEGKMAADTYNLTLKPAAEGSTVVNIEETAGSFVPTTTGWTIPAAASETAPVKLTVPVSGESGTITKSIENARLASIVYTVGVAHKNEQATDGKTEAGGDIPAVGETTTVSALQAAFGSSLKKVMTDDADDLTGSVTIVKYQSREAGSTVTWDDLDAAPSEVETGKEYRVIATAA